MILFDKSNDISIVLSENSEGAIRLAALDLQRDLRALSGRESGFDLKYGAEGRGIYVLTERSGAEEAYNVTVGKNRVTIMGSDALGTVFGIYAFARRCLGISALCRLADVFPEVTYELKLESVSFSSGKRPVRFRGWFINDEDLLTDFKISGGHRRIDYPFYQNVMDTDVLDMILETALRLEINLVIPSSFVDIDNPDEEKLVEAVCRRGMYVSQHHIEPMGVSHFTAENYMKAHGYVDEAISFISNRERMVEMWRYYAEKWSKYGDRVIWQLGLRGRGDQAVWKADPSMSRSMAERGGIISNAIRTQYDIISAVLNTDDFHSTSTLWNEGSELYGKGYLKLPSTTVPVFSDFGFDQMLGEDLYRVGYKMDRKYGVYYHAAFWSRGPHLADGCSPEKMAYNYRGAASGGRLCYSILNVSNVRPLHISAMINAKILEDPTGFAVDEELLRMDKELFGGSGELVDGLRREYYDAFADFGETTLREAATEWSFYLREYGDLSFTRNAATDGHLVSIIKYTFMYGHYDHHVGALPLNGTTRAILSESAERFSRLLAKIDGSFDKIPVGMRTYYKQFVRFPTLYMLLLTEWCIACIDMKNEELPRHERRERGNAACRLIGRILEERKILEEGKWENWHRGDKKLDIRLLLELTKQASEEV